MIEKVSTEDGSLTCRDAETGELYHNRAGAYTEALLNYVQPSMVALLVEECTTVSLLDVCFGLGYNVYAFLVELLETSKARRSASSLSVQVVAIDHDPKIIGILPEILGSKPFDELREAIGVAGEQSLCRFGKSRFRLTEKVEVQFELLCEDVRHCVPKMASTDVRFDLIYHDGFSPKVMPELWTYELFSQYRSLLTTNGKIFTYSSAVAVRGGFRQLGMVVRKTAAVGGKTGGTVVLMPGSPAADNYEGLSREEEERLASRSSVPYRDQGFNSTRDEILRRREADLKGYSK